VYKVNAYKKNQRDLNIWVGEAHGTPQGNYLTVNLSTEITVFASDDGSATIGVVMFVTKSLGFVIQL
jgi:hypothetical protein